MTGLSWEFQSAGSRRSIERQESAGTGAGTGAAEAVRPTPKLFWHPEDERMRGFGLEDWRDFSILVKPKHPARTRNPPNAIQMPGTEISTGCDQEATNCRIQAECFSVSKTWLC